MYVRCQCARLVQRIERLEQLASGWKHQLHERTHPANVTQALAQQVDAQERLRDALADNDRYRVALDWLQHDFHLSFAAFRVQELVLQQKELQTATAATQQSEMWTAPERHDERLQQLPTLYGRLQHALHAHRVKLLGAGLYYKDCNMTQALEWNEADDLDARLFSVLASSEEGHRGRMVRRAVRAEDVCLSTILISLTMHRARDEARQLQDDNAVLRAQLQQTIDDETRYVRSELQREEEGFEQLRSELQQSTGTIMAPFIAAVTDCWQQTPEVSPHPSRKAAWTVRAPPVMTSPPVRVPPSQLQSPSSRAQALDQLVYRHEHLTELDALQPVAEAQLRRALRTALGDSAVSSCTPDEHDETDAPSEANSRAEQQCEEEHAGQKEGLSFAEGETLTGREWPVDVESEKKYESSLNAKGVC